MKLLSWNCKMAFRDKMTTVLDASIDIAVILECEHIDKIHINCHQKLWFGDNKDKGVGIFCFNPAFHLEPLPMRKEFEYVIPLRVTGKEDFILFAIWTKKGKDELLGYIGQVYRSIPYYQRLLKKEVILVGDFNSNKQWDSKRKVGNHSHVVDLFSLFGITSNYHTFFNEAHGEEKIPTYRHTNKSFYHIDYCFSSETFTKRILSVDIWHHTKWCANADHAPLFIVYDD